MIKKDEMKPINREEWEKHSLLEFAKKAIRDVAAIRRNEDKIWEHKEKLARERGLAMEQRTKVMLEEYDRIPLPSLEKRKDILGEFRKNIAHCGIRGKR